MNIKIDQEEFEKRQTRLIQEMASAIRNRLQTTGLGEDQELVESLLFDIGAILDGSAEMKVGGKPLIPFLAFAKNRGSDEVIASKGGSWIHEVCSDAVEKMFEENPPS